VKAQRKFKEEQQLQFPLLSDEGGTISKQYGGTIPALGYANRATFVVGQDGIVKEIITGKEAIDPGGAIAACPLRKPAG
jgi:thioredoxin-dependent peroxiredoxin